MTSKRKLEEKIAESKDPVIRKQLQELLDLRNKRSKQRKDKVVNFIKKADATAFPPDTRTEKEKQAETRQTWIILAIVFAILAGVFWWLIAMALSDSF